MSLPISEALRDQPIDRPREIVRPPRPPKVSSRAIPGLDLVDDTPGDNAPRHWESLWGFAFSLGVHLALLAVLGLLVFDTADREHIGSLVGVLGKSGDDLPAEFILDEPNSDPGGSPEEIDAFAPSVPLREVGEAAALAASAGGGTGAGAGPADGDGVGIEVPAVNVPSHAVTKGSFSAWTEPKDPEPGHNYQIIIQVRLAEKLLKNGKYRLSDITGLVRGTDTYQLPIKFNSKQSIAPKDGTVELVIRTPNRPPAPATAVVLEDGIVQLSIEIPGAAQLVRDTIRIESKLLKEKQVIELVF
jgi:hypothetical protein